MEDLEVQKLPADVVSFLIELNECFNKLPTGVGKELDDLVKKYEMI